MSTGADSHPGDTTMKPIVIAGIMLSANVAGAAEPVAFHAEAKVEIDASGKPTRIEASTDLPEAVRSFIEKKVATWQFAPPSRDGVTGSGVTYLKLGACAVPVANGYRMAIDYKGNGPRISGSSILSGPRYPPSEQRSGRGAQMAVKWIVEPDGRATLERVERTDGAKVGRVDPFEKTIREWVATLRYEPEQFSGHSVRTRVTTTVSFTVGDGSGPATHKQALIEKARQSPECQLADARLPTGLQPVRGFSVQTTDVGLGFFISRFFTC